MLYGIPTTMVLLHSPLEFHLLRCLDAPTGQLGRLYGRCLLGKRNGLVQLSRRVLQMPIDLRCNMRQCLARYKINIKRKCMASNFPAKAKLLAFQTTATPTLLSSLLPPRSPPVFPLIQSPPGFHCFFSGFWAILATREKCSPQ